MNWNSRWTLLLQRFQSRPASRIDHPKGSKSVSSLSRMTIHIFCLKLLFRVTSQSPVRLAHWFILYISRLDFSLYFLMLIPLNEIFLVMLFFCRRNLRHKTPSRLLPSSSIYLVFFLAMILLNCALITCRTNMTVWRSCAAWRGFAWPDFDQTSTWLTWCR